MFYTVGPDEVGDLAVEFNEPGHSLGERFPLKPGVLEVLVDLVVEFNVFSHGEV